MSTRLERRCTLRCGHVMTFPVTGGVVPPGPGQTVGCTTCPKEWDGPPVTLIDAVEDVELTGFRVLIRRQFEEELVVWAEGRREAARVAWAATAEDAWPRPRWNRLDRIVKTEVVDE